MQETRKLATILFADITGYTAIMQSDEAKALAFLQTFKKTLEQFVGGYHGHIIQYFGDACLLSFDSTSQGVRCAMTLQESFQEKGLPVRIGMHLGEVVFSENNAFGDGVNIASRIESMGVPGAILLSKTVRDQVNNKSEFELASLGAFEFKNVQEPLEVYAIANEGFTLPPREALQGKFKESSKSSPPKWKIPLAATGLLLVAAILLIWIKPNLFKNAPSDKISIAVLPFTNMSDDASNEWFSIGVTEDILSHLSKIQGLRVISRTSVMQYKDTEKSLPDIARELNVAYVVEGSVRRQADQVLITAQLINADDEHLWADNYDENLQDAFKIQQEVSKKIVNELRVYISAEEEDALNTSGTSNVLALELFAKGRGIADERTGESIERSIDLYKEAIKLDTLFAEAYAEIANSYMLLETYGNVQWRDSVAKALEFVDKALKIDSNISRPYSVRAFTYLGNDWEKARINFEKAVEVNPNDATAHHHFAIFWRDKPGHNEEAARKCLEEITIAHELDPLSYPINRTKYEALLTNRQFDKAKAFFEKTKYLYQKDDVVQFEGLYNSMVKNDLTELIKAYELGSKQEPENRQYMYILRELYKGYMRDGHTSRSYSKRIAVLEPNIAIYTIDSLYHLYRTKQFKVAEKILNDTAITSMFNPFEKVITRIDIHACKDEYDEAFAYNEQMKPINNNYYHYMKTWLYAQKGDALMTYEALRDTAYHPSLMQKIAVFANLGIPDSLYHYMEQINNDGRLMRRNMRLAILNGSDEIEPYRQDPRYIQFLKDNGFPETAYEN